MPCVLHFHEHTTLKKRVYFLFIIIQRTRQPEAAFSDMY